MILMSCRWFLTTNRTEGNQSWKTETSKRIKFHLSSPSSFHLCRSHSYLHLHHYFSLAVSTHIGDKFVNTLKCYSLLVFPTSCPKPLSFLPWEEPGRNLNLLTLREGILAERAMITGQQTFPSRNCTAGCFARWWFMLTSTVKELY